MAEALNYTKRAIQDLLVTAKAAFQQRASKEAELATRIASMLISTKQKFVLPENGRVMLDGLKGLRDIEKIRLPYESIILEYQLGYEDSSDKDRVILLAFEEGEEILILAVIDYAWRFKEKGSRKFTPSRIMMGIPMTNPIKYLGNSDYQIQTRVVDMLDHEKIIPLNERAAVDQLVDDVIHSIFELIECLSCKNVKAERIPHKHSAEKYARLGFDEYKELVVYGVDGKHQLSKKSCSGSIKGSCREHLRRGHIRRHPTAGNIWVNSTVVNAGIGACISKIYKVKRDNHETNARN